MRKSVPSLALLPLVALLASPIFTQDRIDLRSGKPLAGVTVVSESFKEVVYTPKGGNTNRKVDADKVLDVYRDGAPGAYLEGRGALASGDFRNAVRLLELAATEAKADWVKEYANFYLGQAALKAGDGNKARAAFQAVLTANANSRLLPEARLGMAESFLTSGNAALAQTEASKFQSEVSAKNLAPRYRIEARMIEAKSLESQKRYVEASGAYKRLSEDARKEAEKPESPETKNDLMGLALRSHGAAGSALIAGGKHGEAESMFRQLETTFRGDDRAASLADVGKAEAAFGRGNLDDARIDASRVIATCTESAVRPKAYLLLARIYMALDKNGEQKARGLAKDYLLELMKLHPAAPETAEAQNLLGQLR